MKSDVSRAESVFDPCRSVVRTGVGGISGAIVPFIPMALMGIGLLLRFHNLGADPSHLFDADFLIDEGGWAHNARNQFLYGQWFFGDHDSPYFTAPGYSYLLLLVFKICGLSINSARMISVVSGGITVYLLYLFLIREADRIEATISSMFIALSSYHIMYSMVSLIEALMTMMLMLTLLLWRMSKVNKLYGIAAGACLTAMFIVKISSFYFAPIFILLWFFEIVRDEFDMKSFLCFTVGAIVPMVFYIFMFILPNRELFINYNFVIPSASGAGFNLKFIFQYLLLNKFFILSPVLTLVTLACLLSILFRGIEDWAGTIRELTYSEIVAISIILGNSILLAVSSQQPERRYIPMILGFAILAGHFAASYGKSAHIPADGRSQNRLIAGLLYGCIFFPLFLFVISTLNPELGRWLARVLPVEMRGGMGEMGFLLQTMLFGSLYVLCIFYMVIGKNHRINYESAFLLVMGGVSAYLAYSIFLFGSDYFSMDPPPGLSFAVFCGLFLIAYHLLKAAVRSSSLIAQTRVLVVAVFILIEGVQLGPSILTPNFSIRDFGVQIIRATGGAPIITNYSGPFLNSKSPVYYGYPSDSALLSGKEGYYILTCYKSNSFYISPHIIYHPREAVIPATAKAVQTYEIAPYGIPTKYRWSFVLWHVPG